MRFMGSGGVVILTACGWGAACSSFTASGAPTVAGDASADAVAPPSTDASIDPPIAVAAGGSVACALRQSGRLACWGSNVYGAIGVDPTGDQDCSPGATACRQTATTPSYVQDVRQVAVGDDFVCAVTHKSALLCWGKNGGDAAIGNGTSSPDHVVAPYLLGLADVVDVAVTKTGGCARAMESGGMRVHCWGSTTLGLTGQPHGASVVGPTVFPALDGAKAVSMSANFPGMACAVLADGSVRCWGTDQHGALGSVGQNNDDCLLGIHCTATPQRIGDASFVADDVQVGDGFACALRGGSVFCWGNNNAGALGLGHTDDDAHPTPTLVPGLSGVTKLSAHGGHACAIVADGELRCWGLDSSGELAGFTGEHGAGLSASASVESAPSRATSLAGFTDVASGSGFTIALAGTQVQAFGNDTSGQLGHLRASDPTGVCNDAKLVCNTMAMPVVLP